MPFGLLVGAGSLLLTHPLQLGLLRIQGPDLCFRSRFEISDLPSAFFMTFRLAASARGFFSASFCALSLAKASSNALTSAFFLAMASWAIRLCEQLQLLARLPPPHASHRQPPLPACLQP